MTQQSPVPVEFAVATALFARADWTLIPERMQRPLRRFIAEGIVPGRFLAAILMNDLKLVTYHADLEFRSDPEAFDWLRAIIIFLDQFAPPGCWGTAESVGAWNDIGGLHGLARICEHGAEALS